MRQDSFLTKFLQTLESYMPVDDSRYINPCMNALQQAVQQIGSTSIEISNSNSGKVLADYKHELDSLVAGGQIPSPVATKAHEILVLFLDKNSLTPLKISNENNNNRPPETKTSSLFYSRPVYDKKVSEPTEPYKGHDYKK